MFKWILGVALCINWEIGSASTSVGQGGEMYHYYLKRIRNSIRIVAEGLKPLEKVELCDSIPNRNEEDKVSECNRFIKNSLPFLIYLTNSKLGPELKFSTEPLYTKYPDGQDRPVVAKTNLGPKGDILFHLGSLKEMSPKEIFAVLMHEYGHKLPHDGVYTEDFEPTETYKHGHELLDDVGMALAEHAIKIGQLGKRMALLDEFSCSIKKEGSPFAALYTGSSFRRQKGKDGKLFETSIGMHEGDLKVEVLIGEDEPELWSLEVLMEGKAPCHPSHENNPNQEAAKTMIKVNKAAISAVMSENELISKQLNYNPICEEVPERKRWTIQVDDIVFSCKYTKSQGIYDEPKIMDAVNASTNRVIPHLR